MLSEGVAWIGAGANGWTKAVDGVFPYLRDHRAACHFNSFVYPTGRGRRSGQYETWSEWHWTCFVQPGIDLLVKFTCGNRIGDLHEL